jgi:hypothetical protein
VGAGGAGTAVVGSCGPSWAFVGLRWPSLAGVGLRWSSGLMVGDGRANEGVGLAVSGVRNENAHPRLAFASEGDGVDTGRA